MAANSIKTASSFCLNKLKQTAHIFILWFHVFLSMYMYPCMRVSMYVSMHVYSMFEQGFIKKEWANALKQAIFSIEHNIAFKSEYRNCSGDRQVKDILGIFWWCTTYPARQKLHQKWRLAFSVVFWWHMFLLHCTETYYINCCFSVQNNNQSPPRLFCYLEWTATIGTIIIITGIGE